MRMSDWSSDVCSSDLPSLGAGLDPLVARFAGKRIIAVTSHRRENFGDGMKAIADAIAGIAARDGVAVVFPVHPNPHVRSAMEPILGNLANVALIDRSEEHTSELQSLMRNSYAVFCL